MNRGPLLDETPSRSGIDISGNHLAIQPELRLLALILRMEVRRLMLSIKHANYDAKESRNDRHGFKFIASRKDAGRSNGFTISRKRRELQLSSSAIDAR